MAFDPIGLALSLLLGAGVGMASGLPSAPDRLFHSRERAVGGWRWEAASNLEASPATRAALLLGRDPVSVSRCVRLNNYWCIKRGGWSGEIAADADGHVAFASAVEGATVAALLLRRYYVDYGRRSALAIVSRWAPASCGDPAVPAVHGRALAGPARRGPGGTLRARWLAAHGRRVAGFGRTRGRASSVPDPLIGATLPAPTIALGLGAAPVGLSASLPESLAARPGPAPPLPARPACGDAVRIRNYAARAASGAAASLESDLGLFDDAGRPTARLARVMRNMAAVEIGPLGVDGALVEAAIARATEAVAARRPAPGNPGAAARARLDEGRPAEPHP